MPVWSAETVELENEMPSSSSDVQPPIESEEDDSDSDNWPCDSTTKRNFDRLMTWLEPSNPDVQMEITDGPMEEWYPNKSNWVKQWEQQQERQGELHTINKTSRRNSMTLKMKYDYQILIHLIDG